VPGGVDEVCRPVARIQIPMEARRLVDLAQVAVLRQEAPELGVEVPGLGVVEAGLLVVDVSGEREAVP
jgi:hypothetical protein